MFLEICVNLVELIPTSHVSETRGYECLFVFVASVRTPDQFIQESKEMLLKNPSRHS